MMLKIPAGGFANSVNVHRGSLDIQADWIEASALFAASDLYRTEIVGALIANSSYQSQDFASEWVSNVFSELDRRFALLGDAGSLTRKGDGIHRQHDWTLRPAYSFCVALGMLPHYREEVKAACGENYGEQGLLFERLSAEALRAADWSVSSVGWSKAAVESIEDKVNAIAAELGEPSLDGAAEKWSEPHAKDAGLDLVAWRGFPDGRGGRPVCLVQCASGADWKEKLHTPNLNTWEKLIDFTTRPRRGLAMLFAPEADDFRRKSNSDLVMLLMDRHRLLAPARGAGVALPSLSLATDLVTWTAKRVAAFPTDAT